MLAATVEERFQRMSYRPVQGGKAGIRSGLSRHYPTVHGNLVLGS